MENNNNESKEIYQARLYKKGGIRSTGYPHVGCETVVCQRRLFKMRRFVPRLCTETRSSRLAEKSHQEDHRKDSWTVESESARAHYLRSASLIDWPCGNRLQVFGELRRLWCVACHQLGNRILDGVPKGIRTPVTAVKGRCPRPLDDGDTDYQLL